MAFRVGQKVVCVDDRQSYIDASKACPLRCGAIYEIDGIYKTPDGELHLKVPGLTPYFHRKRFRPIVERKTDISIFKKMLTPQGVDA